MTRIIQQKNDNTYLDTSICYYFKGRLIYSPFSSTRHCDLSRIGGLNCLFQVECLIGGIFLDSPAFVIIARDKPLVNVHPSSQISLA